MKQFIKIVALITLITLVPSCSFLNKKQSYHSRYSELGIWFSQAGRDIKLQTGKIKLRTKKNITKLQLRNIPFKISTSNYLNDPDIRICASRNKQILFQIEEGRNFKDMPCFLPFSSIVKNPDKNDLSLILSYGYGHNNFSKNEVKRGEQHYFDINSISTRYSKTKVGGDAKFYAIIIIDRNKNNIVDPKEYELFEFSLLHKDYADEIINKSPTLYSKKMDPQFFIKKGINEKEAQSSVNYMLKHFWNKSILFDKKLIVISPKTKFEQQNPPIPKEDALFIAMAGISFNLAKSCLDEESLEKIKLKFMTLMFDRYRTKKQLIFAVLLTKQTSQTMRIGMKDNVDLCNSDIKEMYKNMMETISTGPSYASEKGWILPVEMKEGVPGNYVKHLMPVYEEIISYPYPKKWAQNHVGSVKTKGVLMTFQTPSGKKDEEWKDMLTVQGIRGVAKAQGMSPEKYMLYLKQENDKKYPNKTYFRKIYKGDISGYPAMIALLGLEEKIDKDSNKSKPDVIGELILYLIIQGKSDLYTMSRIWKREPFAEKGVPVSQKEIDEWVYKVFRKVKVINR